MVEFRGSEALRSRGRRTETRPGQDVRMADIPADAGAGPGLFENLHGYADGKTFVNRIEYLAKINYGAPDDAWLVWLTVNTETPSRTEFARRLMPWLRG